MNLKVDTEKLKELLVNFYDVAKVRTVIFDNDFNKIIAYPEHSCDFCSLLKENPKSKKLCNENDKMACAECKKNDNLFIYKCHAGLYEVAAPLKMNDITLGYIMLGQVIDRNSDSTQIFDYASTFTDDKERLLKAQKRLHKKTEQQIKSIAKLMEMCTCYLEITKLISVDEDNLIFHLSNYINNNINTDLSVENILSRFKISRSNLYDISHKYYGMSIAKYIRKRRVSLAAQHLLKEGVRVNEAAEFAGFTDYNYFSKIFKAELGVTPSEYKKKLNKGAL